MTLDHSLRTDLSHVRGGDPSNLHRSLSLPTSTNLSFARFRLQAVCHGHSLPADGFFAKKPTEKSGTAVIVIVPYARRVTSYGTLLLRTP